MKLEILDCCRNKKRKMNKVVIFMDVKYKHVSINMCNYTYMYKTLITYLVYASDICIYMKTVGYLYYSISL